MAEHEFPGNNPKARESAEAFPGIPAQQPNPEREKKVEKIEGLGEVMIKKPSLGSRFKNTFFSGDAKGTASHVWSNIIVPMAQNALLDAIQQGSERMVVGQVRSRSSMGGTLPNLLGLGHQAYNKMYAGPMPGPGLAPVQARQQQRAATAQGDFSSYVLGSRAQAEVVIDRMYDLLSRDGVVTVADFLDLLGAEKVEYTLQGWGWMDLRGSQVVRVPQGYLIDLPKPAPLS